MTAGTDRIQEQIRAQQATVAVIGLGYVGLPLAVGFARAGVRVLGIDVDAERVARLNRGQSHIPDVPDAELAPTVQYHDPHVPEVHLNEDATWTAAPVSRLQSVPLTADLVAEQDCVCLAVAHQAFDLPWLLARSGLLLDATGATRRLPPGGGTVIRL